MDSISLPGGGAGRCLRIIYDHVNGFFKVFAEPGNDASKFADEGAVCFFFIVNKSFRNISGSVLPDVKDLYLSFT